MDQWHEGKESIGSSPFRSEYGPPPSPTLWYSARANLRKGKTLDTDIGRCLLSLPVNSPVEQSSQPLEENPFMLSCQDPLPPVNTFGKKLLESLVDEMNWLQ